MDVDNMENDFDGKFFDQFNSMGTTDKDVLIAEFQAVLGNQVNKDSCAFFLDMNNWNLQNAVCSYYDFEQPSNTVPSMALVSDTTVGQIDPTTPNTAFLKKWKIKNCGMDRWPPGCSLRYCSGEKLSSLEWRTVDALSPGEEKEITIEMVSPSLPGSYSSVWRMSTPTGVYFGETIQMGIVVVACQVLSPLVAGHCGSMDTSSQQSEAVSGGDIDQEMSVLNSVSNKMQHPSSTAVSEYQGSTSILDDDTEMS